MSVVIDGTTGINTIEPTIVPAALNATGDAPLYAARAWVNFNGTGTVAIRASGNVTSITDNGTGDYTINFTTAMVDADYTAVFGSQYSSTTIAGLVCETTGTARTASSIQVRTANSSNAGVVDLPAVQIAIFR